MAGQTQSDLTARSGEESVLVEMSACCDEDETTRADEDEAPESSTSRTSSSETTGSQPLPRRISFSDSVSMHPALNLEEYSMAEHYCSWYSICERDRLYLHRLQVIGRMERGKPCMTKEMTYRGLENWTKSGRKRVETQVRSVVETVLKEQGRQRTQGINDSALLAEKSVAATQISAERALELAQEDGRNAFIGKVEQSPSGGLASKLPLSLRRDSSSETRPAGNGNEPRKKSSLGSWWSNIRNASLKRRGTEESPKEQLNRLL